MKLKGKLKTTALTIGSALGYIAIITGIIMAVLILETIYSGI
ncbi:MAG: hypothetical protein ACNA7I_00150 [Candidatus Methanoperedens sp.]|nr:hypothetical protein [Candidatus Methanoperedens sp.]